MVDLTGIVDQLTGQLGPLHGEPVPLEGGITNRNFRVRFGAGDYVRPASRQGHGAARDRPDRRADRE